MFFAGRPLPTARGLLHQKVQLHLGPTEAVARATDPAERAWHTYLCHCPIHGGSLMACSALRAFPQGRLVTRTQHKRRARARSGISVDARFVRGPVDGACGGAAVLPPSLGSLVLRLSSRDDVCLGSADVPYITGFDVRYFLPYAVFVDLRSHEVRLRRGRRRTSCARRLFPLKLNFCVTAAPYHSRGLGPRLQERTSGGALPWMLPIELPEASLEGDSLSREAFVAAVTSALPDPNQKKVRSVQQRADQRRLPAADARLQPTAQVVLACGDGLRRSEFAARLLMGAEFSVAVRTTRASSAPSPAVPDCPAVSLVIERV